MGGQAISDRVQSARLVRHFHGEDIGQRGGEALLLQSVTGQYRGR